VIKGEEDVLPFTPRHRLGVVPPGLRIVRAVPLEPSHPDEPALHRALRDALNRELTTPNFFVWIKVKPTGKSREFADLPTIVRETESWLLALDPDSVDGSELPDRTFSDRAANVEIRAIPKKREARGYRSAAIVGNPEPALAGWV
jgi:hypothetical protein